MTKKKLFMVSLNEEHLKAAMEAKHMTFIDLAGNKQMPGYICDVVTIRRARKDAQISRSILDAIGKKLDVNPDFLSGEFDYLVDDIDDPVIREIFKEEFLIPEKHSYSHHLLEHTDYKKTFEMILSSHGVSQEEYYQQPADVRHTLESRIDELIVRTLRSVFPSAMWAEFIQAGFGYKDMTTADKYKMIMPTLIKRGLVSDPYEDEEFLKAWDDAEDPFAEKYGVTSSNPPSNAQSPKQHQ